MVDVDIHKKNISMNMIVIMTPKIKTNLGLIATMVAKTSVKLDFIVWK
jgi:hypothetical protein